MQKTILVAVLIFYTAFSFAQDQIVVSGTIRNAKRDTVRIIISENSNIGLSRTVYVKMENGSFRQVIPLKRHAYINVAEGTTYISGFMKPGDEVGVSFDAGDPDNTLVLTGTPKETFGWLTDMGRAKLNKKLVEQAKIAKQQPLPFDYLYHYIDSTYAYYLSQLKQIKNIDALSEHILKAQIEGRIHSDRFFGTTYIFGEPISETLNKRQQQLTPASRKVLAGLFTFSEQNYNSPLYINSIFNVLSVNYSNLVFTKEISPALSVKYRFIDSLLPGKLKQPILAIFLYEDIRVNNQGEDLLKMVDYVFANNPEPVYHDYVEQQLARSVLFKKGSPAPAFTVENEKGEKVSLASFKGKVVYMDFWFSTCGPCHSLFAEIKPVKEYFKNKDVVFLTISIDDRNVWREALKKFKIAGYHAYTEDKERAHPVISDYKVQGYPSTFLIDKNGNIFLARPSANPDELKSQIEEALKQL